MLKADHPLGPFIPHSKGEVTPKDWECLDGTLYLSPQGKPYIVFCHEHTQIIDGTICYAPLSDDLTEASGEPVTLFKASEPEWANKNPAENEHFVTDGPFMYRTKTGELLMLWSSFILGQYAECLVKFKDGTLQLTYHTPNKSGFEHPQFVPIEDMGTHLQLHKNQ